MGARRVGRRGFIKGVAGTAAASVPAHLLAKSAAGGVRQESAGRAQPAATQPPRLKFSVIGINHGHINSQVAAVQRAGGQLVSVFAKEPDLLADFVKRYPGVKQARSEAEILEDPQIALVLSAAIPDERAPLGIRVMQHGKDYMSDKPGITTLDQLAEVRKAQAETKRIYSIMYSERFENRATVRAGELVKAGAIGKVIQTIGLGPHRMNPKTRPAWFFERPRYGGILCDIGSHQADQFLYFTGSRTGEVVASQVGNVHHPEYPGLEDFGDVMLKGDAGTGYVRVDWFTPDGLATWGDGRLTVIGTDGFIEIRKNVDIGGRGLGSHLFLVDQKDTRYIDCSQVELPYGKALVDDVLNRTETAMTQEHCFHATELMLTAQARARVL